MSDVNPNYVRVQSWSERVRTLINEMTEAKAQGLSSRAGSLAFTHLEEAEMWLLRWELEIPVAAPASPPQSTSTRAE